MGTMSEQCYLGVDLGAESGRVVAGLFDGHSVRLEELHRFSNGPVRVGGTLRWNVLGLWQGIQQGLAVAGSRFGDSVQSVGVDTWGVDYVLLSARDELLGLPWHYRDDRTTGMLATACERVPREEIFAATGLQFMELNTLYQLLAMKRDHPELLDQARRLLLIPDYFHWLLCGSRVVEFTNATTTQCFDPSRNDWATELLGRFELPAEIFPEVVPPGTSLGQLRDDVAVAAGLERIDVIAPATHDTGSAVAAVPTDRTGSATWTYISSGTWSLMGAGVFLALAASIGQVHLSTTMVFGIGICAGSVYVLGFTLLHENVDDQLRGRIFSTFYVLVRACILLALVVGPLMEDLLDRLSSALWDRHVEVFGVAVDVPGVRLTLWLASLIILASGAVAIASLRAGELGHRSSNPDRERAP